MNDNLFNINERARTRSTQLFGIGAKIIIILCCFASIWAQNSDEYKIVGRVVDDNGKPVSGVDIWLEPVIYKSQSFERFIESESTDSVGRFTTIWNKKKVSLGDKHFLFVSNDNTVDTLTTISPPFDWLREYDKSFNGKLVKFGSEDRIDVGDVKVQFWYGRANLTFSRIAANKINWSQIFLQIRNKNGHRVYFRSLNQENIKRYVKNNGTEFAISLPEGRWKVEIIEFDTRRTLAQSPYFIVKKNSTQEIVMSSRR